MNRLGLVVALAAFAAAGRLAFLWFPNVALTYFVTFVAGVGFGAAVGFWTGFLSMVVTNLLLSALHPVLLVNSLAMGLLGVLGGGLGRAVDFGQARDRAPLLAASLAAIVGIVATFAFSVLADAFSWLLFYRAAGAGGVGVLGALLVAGLAFNMIPAVANGALFALGTYPVLRALRKAGLLPERYTSISFRPRPQGAADQLHRTASPLRKE